MKIGPIILLLAFIFAVIETRYFGSSFLPSCPEEVMADGIVSLIMAIGLLCLAVERKP